MAEIEVMLPRLHAGQERRRAEIAETESRFVVTMCGRRWGKSTDAVEWLADGAMEGLPCALFAPTYKYLAPLWQELATRLRPVAEKGGKINETEKVIRLPNGGLIDCWSLDTADPGRGRKYARIAVDEAGIVRDLLNIWTTALRPTLVDMQGDAWFYGTPKGRLHGFSQLFSKGDSGEPDWLSFRAPTRDNPYIPLEEIEAARRDMPPSAFAQEFEGIPADDGANPFGAAAIAACVGALSPAEPVVWGWDFARAQDWTVGVALDALGHVCRFERWQLVPWGETIDRVVRLTGECRSYGDSTGIGDVVVEAIQKRRVHMDGVHFSRPEKQQLMERLASAIQRGTIRVPDGPLRNELDTFQYEYTATGVRYEAPPGLHDDCVMALALAVKGLPEYRVRRDPVVGGKQPDRAQSLEVQDGRLVKASKMPTTVEELAAWAEARNRKGQLPHKERLPRRTYR